ncbi:hypothetical protein [Metapseudomonas furukawaii]|nr:hypothetical protein [Pseudomonas furukawaii]
MSKAAYECVRSTPLHMLHSLPSRQLGHYLGKCHPRVRATVLALLER